MHTIETVILLMSLVVVIAIFSQKLKIVLPILLTIAGFAVSFIPGLPKIEIDPSLVLLVFLPPILYSAAWYTNWHEFKHNFEPIFVLAVGLVLTTTIGIAYFSSWLMPAFTLPLGILLGAIISPPDAVAANAVLKKIHRVPKKVVSILEGESLVNDASALVALKLAILAVITNQFSILNASTVFIKLAIGGIMVGIIIGWLSYKLHKHFSMQASIETILTFVTAYASYIIAERLHLSGVLATVTAGLFMGSKQSALHKADMRLKAIAVWDFVIVVLNGLIFIIIGLQLPVILNKTNNFSNVYLIFYGIVISIAAIFIRFFYIFLADAISNLIRRKLGKPTVFKSKKHTFILAFTAMRGIVSLAAAASIPFLLDNGQVFPMRDEIIFITFIVVIFTLILQGLLLPWVIKKLGIVNAEEKHYSTQEIRKILIEQSTKSTEQFCKENEIDAEVVNHILDIKQRQFDLYFNQHDNEVLNKKEALNLVEFYVKEKRRLLTEYYASMKIDEASFQTIMAELDFEEINLYRA